MGPRFAIEALFLIALAVGVAYADLATKWIFVVMAGGWLVVALLRADRGPDLGGRPALAATVLRSRFPPRAEPAAATPPPRQSRPEAEAEPEPAAEPGEPEPKPGPNSSPQRSRKWSRSPSPSLSPKPSPSSAPRVRPSAGAPPEPEVEAGYSGGRPSQAESRSSRPEAAAGFAGVSARPRSGEAPEIELPEARALLPPAERSDRSSAEVAELFDLPEPEEHSRP